MKNKIMVITLLMTGMTTICLADSYQRNTVENDTSYTTTTVRDVQFHPKEDNTRNKTNDGSAPNYTNGNNVTTIGRYMTNSTTNSAN